jgi:uncharacterized protein
MNLKRWFEDHSLKLLAIRDTPEAIAGGVAIGVLFGFSPLFGLKTLGAMLLAWLTRSNILAAVIAVTLHDLVLPLMPVLYWWEYSLGYWMLNHEWPKHEAHFVFRLHELLNWTVIARFGPALRASMVGWVIIGLPASAASYVATKVVIIRHRRKKSLASTLALTAGDTSERDPGPQV